IEDLKAQLEGNVRNDTWNSVKTKVLAPGMYAIDVEPIPPRLKNNRNAHLTYINHLKESVETVREIVEEARVVKPLDNVLNYACQYTKLSQELVEYVIGTCPKEFTERDSKAPSIPLTRKNSTRASGSKPRSNTKHNRILPAKSVNNKKVEDHPRTNKSIWTKVNRVDSGNSSKRVVVQIILWYLDSGCSKHMTGNRSKLKNFVEKFIGIYNKRTRRIMETIHVTFDELHQTMAPVRISSGPEPKMMFGQNSSSLDLHQMLSAQISSGLAPQCLKMFEHSSSSLGLYCQKTFKQISSNLVSNVTKASAGISSGPIRKGNLLLDLQKLQMNPIFRISVDIFVRTGVYSFQVDEHWLTLSVDLLRKALNVTPADSAHPFESPPAGKTNITFTRRGVPLNWLMKIKFNRLMNLIWMIMSTIYNKTTRKLPVVEVKGKGSATDVQAAKSLLELHKPKKQRTMD
ncbi:hypothetical protein Tco_0464581, partial [Tanacetum coccineum]